jgi:hypothetical protein
MPETTDYLVILLDERVNVPLEYLISGAHCGSDAITRAKAQACFDSGLRYTLSAPFSVISVSAKTFNSLVVV